MVYYVYQSRQARKAVIGANLDRHEDIGSLNTYPGRDLNPCLLESMSSGRSSFSGWAFSFIALAMARQVIDRPV